MNESNGRKEGSVNITERMEARRQFPAVRVWSALPFKRSIYIFLFFMILGFYIGLIFLFAFFAAEAYDDWTVKRK